MKNTSTLRNKSDKNKIISIPYHNYTNGFERLFRDHSLKMTLSNRNSQKSLRVLGKPKFRKDGNV